MANDEQERHQNSSLLDSKRGSIACSQAEAKSDDYLSMLEFAGNAHQSRELLKNLKQYNESSSCLDFANIDQSSSSVYWDSQNVNFANVTNSPCEEVKSENILKMTSLESSNLPNVNVNHHISLETIINRFERENARLSEKVDRLALKEETSSFLNLTESQKLRQDVNRIEEINLRLRRCLAERLTKERELQEKIEHLQSDICIKSGHVINQDMNDCLKSHILRDQEMIKFFLGSNFYDAMQYGEERSESLEKRIDQLAANVSAVERQEKELMKKSRIDDLTIKQLCLKVDALKCDCKVLAVPAGENSSLSNCEKYRNCSEDSVTKQLRVLNEEKTASHAGNIFRVTAIKDGRASYSRLDDPVSQAKFTSEPITCNHNQSTDILEDDKTNVSNLNDESFTVPPTFSACLTSSPKTDMKQQNLGGWSPNAIFKMKYEEKNSSLQPKLSITDWKRTFDSDKVYIPSSICTQDCSISLEENKKSVEPSKEARSDYSKIFHDLRPSVEENFSSETILERSCVTNERLESNTATGNQIRNLVEFFETDPKKSLPTNRSVCSLSNNATFHGFGPRIPRGKVPDEFIRAEQESLDRSSSDKYPELVGGEKTIKIGMKGSESKAESDRFYESKLSYLEKYIRKLGEQLKFVEKKLAFVDPNNHETHCIFQNRANRSNFNLHKSNLSLKKPQMCMNQNGETTSQLERFILSIDSDNQSNQEWRIRKLGANEGNRSTAKVKNNDVIKIPCISGDSTQELPAREYLLGVCGEDNNLGHAKKIICSTIPLSKKFFHSGNVQTIMEINVSASVPTQMNMKFVDSEVTGTVSKKDSPENSQFFSQKEVKNLTASTESKTCPLIDPEEFLNHSHLDLEKGNCFVDGPVEFSKDRTYSNLEKYFSLLGNRCRSLETTLKEQEQQCNLLCSVLNSEKNEADIMNEASAHDNPILHKIEATRAANLCSQPEQNNGFITNKVSQSEGGSVSNDEIKQLLPEDQTNCELLEKYISKLIKYMKDIEKCLGLQKQTQLHFLNIIQNCSFIRSIDLVASESLKTVHNPSCSLKETQSHFNENFSRSPSEDNYFMIKACSSKELLVDQTSSSNIWNSGPENNRHQKWLKTNEKAEHNTGNVDTGSVPESLNLKDSQFKALEGQCGKLERHLKIIEANLKYQDAIYHYLETCVQKKRLEIDLADTSFADQVLSHSVGQQKIRDPKLKGRRKISKTRRENKLASLEDKEALKTCANKLRNIQLEDPGFLEGPMRKSFDASKINTICDSDSTMVSNPVAAEVRENFAEKLNQTNFPFTENQEIFSKSARPSETTSENKLNSQRECYDPHSLIHSSNSVSFVDTQRGKHFTSITPDEVIHRKIQRIGKNTALLEKQLDNHRIKSEEKHEINRQLRKLLKEKELVSKYLMKNKLLDG